MTENYLDISKSVMISSPAGSGKTEKLARRYIALLKEGSDVERILAITFTEKAAAEMKERILNILKKEDPEMFIKVREKMPRMRISTIHSFCLKLLKRFCIELEMDPSLEVVDSFNADILWSESIYESILEDNLSGEGLFHEVIMGSGIKGWDKLYDMLCELHAKRPAIEFGVRDSEFRIQVSGENNFKRILSIYAGCLARYRRKKLDRHFVDYNDLELMAYEAISKNPEWQNVLYSFDEHTDHILVDEFQDTSFLQWKIIDKLTEEWRSGQGAKRERGVRPTIFLVGDDKQSIYSFRGANVSIFKNAKEKLNDWLRDEYHFIEIRKNYRSLPAIINFVNTLFEGLMPKGLYDDYKVEYTSFEATRQGEGSVGLILLDSIGNTKDNRKAEAAVIAKKIKELTKRYEIYDNNSKKPCGYGDMAILLRNRTHLSVFEDALRRQGIPFVVLKGIGFYNEPEVRILRDALFFLIDPMDDYSLFSILRSPLFSIGYDTLLKVAADTAIDDVPYGYLFESLKKYAAQSSIDQPLYHSIASINNWLEMAKSVPYAALLEEMLSESQAWQYFHEKQRYVNVKKFIRLVEEFESKGLTRLEIREKLIKASARADEAKANVNTEGIDAVKIMTVHASKGLQFPVVFLPCLDEESRAKGTGRVFIDENENGIVITYEEDPDVRKTMPALKIHGERIQDEEKRLFYVAATRAMDYLCMSGILKDNPTGKLAYLEDAGFAITDSGFSNDLRIERVRADDEQKQNLHERPAFQNADFRIHEPAFTNEIVFTDALDYRPQTLWLDVTEEMEHIRKKHGNDWVVLGRAFHRVFEGMSKGIITMENLEHKTVYILKNEVLSDNKLQKMKDIILSDVARLDFSGYLKEIIMLCENSYSELPFILDAGDRVYKGRIDRVIIKNDTAFIYDYKTYPIAEGEIPDLLDRYGFQMKIYKDAVERLFSLKANAFLFFTHESKLVQAR
ncbi:MAG: UvrD-helicase domain-containing protein [Thermodesulfovibrionales bacterium]|nr:UvrD-helicase domain-containing protein [Thermodesulfovibrionales bacterium]